MKSRSTSIRNGALQGSRGFTIVEVLVVIGIASLLLGLGLFISMDAYRSYSFRSERNNFVSVLEKARMLSLVNVGQAAHGVHVTTSTYTIFEGAAYSPTSSLNEVITIGRTVTITENPTGTDIVFGQLAANVTTSAQFVISDGTRFGGISINHEGQIDW